MPVVVRGEKTGSFRAGCSPGREEFQGIITPVLGAFFSSRRFGVIVSALPGLVMVVAAAAQPVTAQVRVSTSSASTASDVLTPIHDIQGPGTTSPIVGSTVTTRGIVTAVKYNGFFIQAREADYDNDPDTSEGVFVFTSSAPPAAAAVGNEVQVRATVSEYVPASDPISPPITELTSPTISLRSTGNQVPDAVELTAADTSPTGTLEQLERFEGMRVAVPSLTVVAPTDGSVNETSATATSNGVFYGVITGVARPFREPGIEAPGAIPAPPCCIPRFDANPEKLRVDSDGLTGAPKMEVTSGAVITNLVGPLDYAYRTYTILPEPGSAPGVSDLAIATPVDPALADEITIGSLNLERFFDDVNDPDIGDPVLTPQAFANRLAKASLAIRDVMGSPDILGVEEVENLSTLSRLAAKINADALAATGEDPIYVPYLEEGNDVGGIDVGFLVKSTRVTVVSVTQFGKDTIFPYDGSLLNDRPPLVLVAVGHPTTGPAVPVTVIVNHLRSLDGVDDPTDGDRVRHKRLAQAEYLADLVQSRHDTDPAERVVLVGDFNAYQFNDGYVDVMGSVRGEPTQSDQVLLTGSDLLDPDLVDALDGMVPEQRYSYLYGGSAQVLDHALMSANLVSQERRFEYARFDADFPESYRNDPTRPERISDHDGEVLYITAAQPGWTPRTPRRQLRSTPRVPPTSP